MAFRRKDGKVFLVRPSRGEIGNMGYEHTETFEVSWLPGETLAAVISTIDHHGGRGWWGVWSELEIVRFEGVRVNVLGYTDPKAKPDKIGHIPTGDEAARAVAAKLSKLGDFQISWGHTHDAHSETVVFAAPGFEDAAQKVSAALGSAQVKPLDWKADADLVIACVKH